MNTEIIKTTPETVEVAGLLSSRISAGILDQASADKATLAVLTGKDMVKKIRADFAPLKEAASASLEKIRDWEKAELAKIQPLVDQLSGLIAAWRQAETRKRLDAEAAARRAREELDRNAEKVLLEAQVAPPEEQDRILAEAAAREREIPPPVPIPPAPKTAGLAPRDNWKFRIVDAAAVPREYLIPDEVKIGHAVRTSKGLIRIAGVETYNDPTMAKTRI